MPFVNRELTLPTFLSQVYTRLELEHKQNALIFFKTFVPRRLLTEAQKYMDTSVEETSLSAGDFDVVYPLAAEILRDAASRTFSEAHPDIYRTAHQVSEIFCEQLNDTFQCTGEDRWDLIPIKSFVEMAVEGGMVKVEDGMVSLTPEGEAMVNSLEARMQNPRKETE